MLRDDHRTVEQLFKRFEKAGDRAYAEKRRVADRIIEELAVHASIEEQLFYPVVRATVPGTNDVVLESLEEHHVVKWVLSELDAMDPTDERFDPKMTVLIENVRHHVEEEEQELFPEVRRGLDRKSLADLAQAMDEAKKVAPTHPHPRSPDTPPGNVAMGLTTGVVDRIGDTLSGVAQGSVTAVQDLIARILRRENRSASAPTGSKIARKTATSVRASAAGAADDLIAAAQQAKRTAAAARTGARDTGEAAVDEARETLRTARTGAKQTATSARRSAKRTATTAKRAATTTRRRAKAGARKSAATASRATSRTRQAATAD
jgi:hemerythrin superfamily protein